MDLTWEESSGAVAPEFRYAKTFHLFTDVKKIFLSRKIIKNGKLVLEETKEIQPKLYQKWMNELFKKGIHQMSNEKIPEEQITGISYNFVKFRYSSTKSMFYYTLEEINQPEWEEKKAIIESIERMKP
ncbi:permease [Leptospira jelokensis]|uniref:Permease n=2 Tax=Leptospira jelokensis TaxID=2484931 RepID=A0A4Z1A3W7_9LEPT|nr:permease [Leptospira jelokensis]TGM02562.1 permease [Leptospira jelokensis]